MCEVIFKPGKAEFIRAPEQRLGIDSGHRDAVEKHERPGGLEPPDGAGPPCLQAGRLSRASLRSQYHA